MPLAPGTQLGPYEILAPLGAGGMGEVYRAKDTKLDREVAIKVLPDALARDPSRLARFEREAKVLASLNHSNIAQIYGIENNALIMELVHGDTLKIPAKLEYAKQIAEALEAAHEKGIIHRDLKPANIMVTPDGVVKVLDFGLASSPSDSDPTLTMAGAIMGTPAYMSPEQAAGKTVDKRTDIWSFGVVLYEMVTGQRPADPIDFDKIPPGKIQTLLRRCLDRDVKTRLRDIGEARIAITRAITDPGSEAASVGRRHALLPWILTAISTLALIAAATLLYQATRPTPPRPLIRLNAEIAPDMPLARAAGGNMFSLSPDGTRLALTLRGTDGKVSLYTRLLNHIQITPLAGTENASYPFFSPAGDWIGFFADGKLKKISVEGGAAVTLCDAPSGRGASWGDDGNIIAALDQRVVLSRIPSAGGNPQPATKFKPGEASHRWPQVLPGSRAILFTSSTHGGNYDDASIDVISLKSGERKTVGNGGFSSFFLATSASTGHLLYLHQGTLFAVPFDLGRVSAEGSPSPVVEDVSGSNFGGGDFAFAQNGTFVYLSGKGQIDGWSISWVDPSGKVRPLHAPIGRYFAPRFSPDGKRLAFSIDIGGRTSDIWVKDLDRDTPSRLSFLPGGNSSPVWTPDGKNIVFQSINLAAPGLYSIRSDGSGEAQRLTDGKLSEVPYSFSPDGKRLAFHAQGKIGGFDIFTASVEGDPLHLKLGNAELFLGTTFGEFDPAFSPDGRWIAYQSNESGISEVYVRPFPGPGGRWQISAGGANFPVWSHNGHELLFTTPDGRVMAAAYTAKGDSFAPAKPRLWTETRLRRINNIVAYDLAPDGTRLAAVVSEDEIGDKPPTHLTFLLNFFDELRRRAP